MPGQALAFANSDPVYRQLRAVGFGETFRFDNFTLNYDVATFQFQKGTLTWLSPVEGVVTGAIFIGEGHFHLKAVSKLDAHEISRRTGAEEVDEDFTDIVFRFTPDERTKLFPGWEIASSPPLRPARPLSIGRRKCGAEVNSRWASPSTSLHGETMDNVDADVLAAIYNRAHPPFFNAYIRGKKHKDLRFFVRTRVGALPQLDSPEEVALINYDPEGCHDGVWYLAHLKSEYANRTASSQEDRRALRHDWVQD